MCQLFFIILSVFPFYILKIDHMGAYTTGVSKSSTPGSFQWTTPFVIVLSCLPLCIVPWYFSDAWIAALARVFPSDRPFSQVTTWKSSAFGHLSYARHYPCPIFHSWFFASWAVSEQFPSLLLSVSPRLTESLRSHHLVVGPMGAVHASTLPRLVAGWTAQGGGLGKRCSQPRAPTVWQAGCHQLCSHSRLSGRASWPGYRGPLPVPPRPAPLHRLGDCSLVLSLCSSGGSVGQPQAPPLQLVTTGAQYFLS